MEAMKSKKELGDLLSILPQKEILLVQRISDDIKIIQAYHRFLEQNVWVKVFHKSEENRILFEREVFALSNLQHANIIKIKDFFQDEKAYYIILNKVTHARPILHFFKKKPKMLTNATLKYAIQQLLETMIYLDFKKVVHCNLHPNNILWNGKKVVILNWEHFIVGEIDKQKLVLPPKMQPPEKKVTKGLDVWCIGIIWSLFCPKN